MAKGESASIRWREQLEGETHTLTEHSELDAAGLARDEAFVPHANAGEVDQLVAAYYADDAQVLPPNAPPVHGHGQIQELLREMIEAGMGDLNLDTSQLHVAGDLGYGIGTYTSAACTAVSLARRDVGKILPVDCRQTDGSWGVAVEMFNATTSG